MHASTVHPEHRVGEAAVAGTIVAVATVAVAGIGSLATSAGMDWYDSLDKPGFTPPDATFGIVWTILDVAIAVAGSLAWRATPAPRPTAWWAVQMALNLLWTAVFLRPGIADRRGRRDHPADRRGRHRSAGVGAPQRRRRGAAVPYLVWCCCAAALNIGVLALN